MGEQEKLSVEPETVRVYELARRLERSSAEVLDALQAAGYAVTAATSSVPVEAGAALARSESDSEADTSKASPPKKKRRSKKRSGHAGLGESAADTGQATVAAADVGAGANASAKPPSLKPVYVAPVLVEEGAVEGFRLVRKGSVQVGRLKVVKGGTISVNTYGSLPERVRRWFDPIIQSDE